MRVEHVIYLSSAGCSLWSWLDTAFAESPVRTPVGTDPGAVVAELGRLAAGPVAVLVDMIDEEHVRDSVPRLGRRDQQALLERKLGRRFPRTPLRAAQAQGRSAASADEEQALLSALTRPEPVQLLLARLEAARVPVAGVYSPALLASRLLDPAARCAAAVMLVLRRSNGRQQHSLFIDGVLVGSRRLRGQPDPALEDAALMMRQFEESLRYFDPSFEPSAATPLELVLAPADHALLETAAGHGEGWRLRQLDVAALGRRLRLRAPLDAARTERIFIELLRRPGNVSDYLAPGARRYFALFRLRSYARAACFTLAAAGLVGVLYNGLYILDAGARFSAASGTVQRLETVLPDESVALAAGADPLEMQQVVAAYDALEREQAEPAAILAAVGAAVSQRPQIQLDAIEWRAGAPLAATPDGQADPGAEPADDGAEAPAVPSDGVRVTLRGRVRPFAGDYTLAFDEVAAFIDVLRADPAVDSVTTRAQPLDVGSAATLSGEVTRGQVPAEARFVLEIVMRPDHEQA